MRKTGFGACAVALLVAIFATACSGNGCSSPKPASQAAASPPGAGSPAGSTASARGDGMQAGTVGADGAGYSWWRPERL